MNVFHVLPIGISYFEISDIEEKQLEKEYKKFISNIKRSDCTDLKEESFTAKIELDLFSIGFRANKEISVFLKYKNYILEKKEMDPYDPLKKICIDTGNEKLNLILELVSLKPYKIKISGDLYHKCDRKWEVKKFNQIIVL
ncbi:hypothetical protein FC820_14890 [Clostridium sporogenes]|uniref:hypothetical protein n=1 Tax=Clostridium sporogenes TaxID=1509 RepID=UPI0013D12313|nr:hypothetical protein [Clostridium sporogenes]EJE7233806.1 hypothetical protein [Clostridium botulinum]NFE82374.1 hypothetical protein [Clostridium sporogenes]NFG69578.1 hypothetical protein [Clostridium sporogenes]